MKLTKKDIDIHFEENEWNESGEPTKYITTDCIPLSRLREVVKELKHQIDCDGECHGACEVRIDELFGEVLNE